MPGKAAVAVAPQFDLDDIAKRCREIVQYQNSKFLERTSINEASLVTLLAGAHAVIYGPPGTAKTDMIESLCGLVEGAKFGSWLLDKQMGKDELFGQWDLAKYDQHGIWERDIADTVGDCHVIFWDEVYRSGPAVLNTLLTLMQGRKVKPGKVWVPAPVVSIFGASNDYPEPELAAFDDRWLVKLVVDYLVEMSSLATLLHSAVINPGALAAAPTPPTITVDELNFVTSQVIPAIQLPSGIVETMLKLRAQLHSDEVKFSDRRLKQSVRLIQATAFLNGRTTVDDDDLTILQHVLWGQPEQRDKVTRAVMSLTSEFTQAAQTYTDLVAEWGRGIDARKAKSKEERAQYGGEVQFKVSEGKKEIDTLIEKAKRQGRSTVRLEEVKTSFRGIQQKVLTDCMNIAPDRAAARVNRDDADPA